MEDPRGVQHKYEYDEYGRQTDDIVISLGRDEEDVDPTAPSQHKPILGNREVIFRPPLMFSGYALFPK